MGWRKNITRSGTNVSIGGSSGVRWGCVRREGAREEEGNGWMVTTRNDDSHIAITTLPEATTARQAQ